MAEEKEIIETYFDFKLNLNQEHAVQKIKNFLESDKDVFILKGHAGTGKTTLVKGLLQYITKSLKRKTVLMASTGRAASVLNKKTGKSASTIHSYIYALGERKEEALTFRLIPNQDAETTVYFVDESSMISNKAQKGTFLNFGTGSLLNDFIRFAGKRKIVFVGDEYQLPPINSPYAPALLPSSLRSHYQLKVDFIKLETIERQKGSASGISENIENLRCNLEDKVFPYMSIKGSDCDDIHVFSTTHHMELHFSENYDLSDYTQSVFLAFSNRKVNQLNRSIRHRLFDNPPQLVPKDVLMIGRNNYKYGLNNGEVVQIKRLTGKVTNRAGLKFIQAVIEVKINDETTTYQAYIIENFLLAEKPSLSQEEEKNLYVDFVMRMKSKGVKENSKEFTETLMVDPYINALRVRYGYATTCHKAQGGEWANVYIVFENSFFYVLQKPMQYRWAYTAISRASEKLYLLQNMCIY